jgi:hypothetical protein
MKVIGLENQTIFFTLKINVKNEYKWAQITVVYTHILLKF